MAGFTLIEAIVFIVVVGIMMGSFVIGIRTIIINSPELNNQKVALETARGCLEWYLTQRLLNGYTVYACPSTPAPSNCTAPSGFSVSTNITCTTISGDSNYKTITVSVTGLSKASLTTMIGNY